MLRRAALIGLLTALPAYRLTAQCPDGSPPPCRVAAVRRPAPPLDDRTWIVLPFENVARVPDIDWLKDASVNLLYLDMSRWRDIRVIDDERVADFIREVPEATRGPLTLQSGIAVARRAGAGKLVMGDLLKVGSRTQVVAKVFDVRSGNRVRTVRQEATSPDSIMPVFGRLARSVLNVEPPAGTSLGAVGTTSIGAYQAYIAGVASMNHWDLDSARAQFARALALDSGFALAHYKTAVVIGWQAGAGSAEGPRHADAAVRLGTSLPPRERNLVTGYAAFAAQRYADACAVFNRMVQADSGDVEAWYELGECNYHDPVVVPVGGDTTRLAFRSSWNASMAAFKHVLDLDPTYHLAFQHIQDALLATSRAGCRLVGEAATCNPQQGAIQGQLRRAGDSLLIVPVSLANDAGMAFNAQVREAMAQHARSINLEEARRAAEAWIAAGPTETRPRIAYGRILLRLGNLQRADSMQRLVGNPHISRVEDGNYAADRIELNFKLGRGAVAAGLADSLRAFTDSIPGARNLGILAVAIFGKVSGIAPLLNEQIRAPDFVKQYFVSSTLALLGVPQDSIFEREIAFAQMATQGNPALAPRLMPNILASFAWLDPRERRGRWSLTDSTSSDPRIALMSVVASGDAARIHAALARYDSAAASLAEEPDNGIALVGAYAHLAVADTAGALAHLRRFRQSTWAKQPMLVTLGSGIAFAGMLWPRMLLLQGDLAAATGSRAEARDAYQLFIGAWQNGDAVIQPLVQHARDALARLGS